MNIRQLAALRLFKIFNKNPDRVIILGSFNLESVKQIILMLGRNHPLVTVAGRIVKHNSPICDEYQTQ